MPKIRRALISVTDKTGVADFARRLAELSVEIVSTGGTARLPGCLEFAAADAEFVAGAMAVHAANRAA